MGLAARPWCKLRDMAVIWFRRLLLAGSVSGCVIVTERPVDSAPPPAPPAAAERTSPVRTLAEAPETRPAASPAAGSAAPASAPAPAATPAPAEPAALPAPAL